MSNYFVLILLYRDNGTGRWSGIIGDLVNGEIDIAVAGMTMTSEREEASYHNDNIFEVIVYYVIVVILQVVDFVAPYFDQSGISIIIRKPVRPRSLFKFMEVLRVEVSIFMTKNNKCIHVIHMCPN